MFDATFDAIGLRKLAWLGAFWRSRFRTFPRKPANKAVRRTLAAKLAVLWTRRIGRIESERREEDRDARLTRLRQHAACVLKDEFEIGPDLLSRDQPKLGHVDHDQRRPAAESDAARPVPCQVPFAKMV
jgi:hypothetical protein